MCSKHIVVIGMVNKMGFIDFCHSKSWLNNSSARLSEKSNFAVSIVWDLDCANLSRSLIQRKKNGTNVTEASHVVTHRTTDSARCSLTSEIGRDRV